jgi:hypothetical protein
MFTPVYASFGANGQTYPAAIAMLPIPAVLDGSLKFDFMWGVLLAATPTPTPSP